MIVCGMRCSRITNARNLVGSSSNAVLDKRRLDSYNAPSVANFVRYYYYFFCSFLMVLIITLCLCSQFSDRFLGGRVVLSLKRKVDH